MELFSDLPPIWIRTKTRLRRAAFKWATPSLFNFFSPSFITEALVKSMQQSETQIELFPSGVLTGCQMSASSHRSSWRTWILCSTLTATCSSCGRWTTSGASSSPSTAPRWWPWRRSTRCPRSAGTAASPATLSTGRQGSTPASCWWISPGSAAPCSKWGHSKYSVGGKRISGGWGWGGQPSGFALCIPKCFSFRDTVAVLWVGCFLISTLASHTSALRTSFSSTPALKTAAECKSELEYKCAPPLMIVFSFGIENQGLAGAGMVVEKWFLLACFCN